MQSFLCPCLVLAMCLSMTLAQDGYETFPSVPGSRYKLYSTHLTWNEASSLCQGDGGGSHLVVINSVEEAVVVKGLFERITDANFIFVGINDIATEGSWVTVLGGSVAASGYNNWLDGEPNNEGGNEDCGTVNRDVTYNDAPCSYPEPFLCEKPDIL